MNLLSGSFSHAMLVILRYMYAIMSIAFQLYMYVMYVILHILYLVYSNSLVCMLMCRLAQCNKIFFYIGWPNRKVYTLDISITKKLVPVLTF